MPTIHQRAAALAAQPATNNASAAAIAIPTARRASGSGDPPSRKAAMASTATCNIRGA